tara:strand:- start:231 stop:746 length:516 start_codon:yes stop_codon:yes gene_type:complete
MDSKIQHIKELESRVINSIEKIINDDQYTLDEVLKMYFIISEYLYRQNISPIGFGVYIMTQFLKCEPGLTPTLEDIYKGLGFYKDKNLAYEKKDSNLFIIKKTPKSKSEFNNSKKESLARLKEKNKNPTICIAQSLLDKLDLTDDQLSLLQHNLNNEDVDLSDIEELWEKD